MACSMISKIQSDFAVKMEEYLRGNLKWETHGFVLGFLAQFNEYYPMPEKWGSNYEKCTGVESLEPQHWSNKNRMILTYELNPKMINMEQLCDSDMMTENIDPRFLYKERDPGRQESVDK